MKRFDVTEQMAKDLVHKEEELIINGLKLKGYTFDTTKEIYDFIAVNCDFSYNVEKKERVYRVYGKPFLLYRYGDITNTIKNNNFVVSVENSYCYL